MLNSWKTKILIKTGRGVLLARKYSPEILTGVGLLSLVSAVVFSHETKPKALKIMEEHNEKMNRIEVANELTPKEEYSEADYKRDKILMYKSTIPQMCKVYAPVAITTALGITSVLCAFGILKKRNIALIGAYNLISKSYDEYRGRVVKKYGKEEDRLLKNGIVKGEPVALQLTEDGDTEIIANDVVDPTTISGYSKFFDEASAHWSKTPGYNNMYVQSQQDYANDLLNGRGHVFLNDVYDMFDIPRTPEGAIVGWVKGQGDGFVDFGVFNTDRQPVRNFVNGYEKSILLDFNVQGVIWDMI